MKFALNAAVDTLPHNSNLHMWKKKESDSCPLCGERQSLIHVLNCCRVARDLRRYNIRHDAVLKVIADTVKEHLPPSHKLTVDLDQYQFPIHISPTDLRPDIVLWSDSEKQLILAELTVSFETSFEAAAERKEMNYQDLVSRAEQAGYSTQHALLFLVLAVNSDEFQILLSCYILLLKLPTLMHSWYLICPVQEQDCTQP